MTPELETCLNYCDHGEHDGGTPYLPTLRGLIVNAVNAENAALRRELEDEAQKCANLEEYMLKGVAFRDGLQARIRELEGNMVANGNLSDAVVSGLQSRLALLEKVAELPAEWHTCGHHPHLGCAACEIRRRAKEGRLHPPYQRCYRHDE